MLKSLWLHRGLVWQMSRREVVSKYRGSLIGIVWAFFDSILLLSVYTFVFTVIFQARWSGAEEGSKATFAIFLFSGLVFHTFFSDCIKRAPGLIGAHVNYVKKVVFPIEILPWTVMGGALFHLFVSIFVLLVFILVITGSLYLTVFLLPLVLLPFVFFTMGLSWIMASLGVFLKDCKHISDVLLRVMLFMTPIFYPLSRIPDGYRQILYLNPLTFTVEQVRQVLIFGNPPQWSGLFLYAIISLFVAKAGFWWFMKTKKGFADVL